RRNGAFERKYPALPTTGSSKDELRAICMSWAIGCKKPLIETLQTSSTLTASAQERVCLLLDLTCFPLTLVYFTEVLLLLR
ncbi:hypothetical protein RRG08_064947, partial [Elysia crispata]